MMKKWLSILAVGLALAGIAQAQLMDDVEKTYSLITTNSDSDTYVLRGDVEGVWIDVAATKTNTILISDAMGTIFGKDVSVDAFYPIRVPMYSTAGAALTFVGGTNNTANVVYGKRPMADEVTIRAAGAADTTGTNSVTIKLIYRK
jgi:hypothetical protein